ncbi:MAG: hypothetical protein WC753_04080 [Candidatus Gracilibacteria bacterium]
MSNNFLRSCLGYEDPDITAGTNHCIDTAPHCVVRREEAIKSSDPQDIAFALGMELARIMITPEGVGSGSTTRASILRQQLD